MSEVFAFRDGTRPLLVSIPHDGREIPAAIRSRMTATGRRMPDTDWHVRELYAFAQDLGAHVLTANYSRYIVDLNRSSADDELYPGELKTGLCPEQTFGGAAIYSQGGVGAAEKSERIRQYWRPYHEQIASTLALCEETHGYALLWDAHSIPSVVPRLFDGELPELNIGTDDGASCAGSLQQALVDAARQAPYSLAVNARFRGGYITRHYGDPLHRIHAVQLEIAQRAYMDEETGRYAAERAGRLRRWLERMLSAFIEAAERHA